MVYANVPRLDFGMAMSHPVQHYDADMISAWHAIIHRVSVLAASDHHKASEIAEGRMRSPNGSQLDRSSMAPVSKADRTL